jgi:Ser/Thr protein kinase RdoA (MazF antagonist)
VSFYDIGAAASISVTHSIFDGDALRVEIEASYEIGAIGGCRLWRSFINDVYRVEAQGRCVWLRIHPAGWRSESETTAELTAILAIAAAGGAVARPIPRRDGTFMTRISAPEGSRIAVLFEHAAGEELAYAGPGGPENARRYGETVAHLHAACEGIENVPERKIVDPEFMLHEPLRVLARFVSADDSAYLAALTNRIAMMLKATGPLERGFCHGDLNSSNIQFDGDVGTAFDFDCCAWGWRAFELAAFARGVTWNAVPGPAAEVLIKSFLGGYRSVRSLSEADLAIQPAMLIAQRLWVTSLHLQGAARWGAIRFDRPYAARFTIWARAWAPLLDALDR